MAAEPNAPKSRPETLRKRQEILEAAIRVFGSKGYEGGKLVDVAAEVGMTHAGVLHHFGSKENLLFETLRYRDLHATASLGPTGDRIGANFFEEMFRTVRANEGRRGILQAYAVLLGQAMMDDNPGRDYYVWRFRVLRGEIVEALRVLADEEGVEVSQAQLERAATAVIGVMDGVQAQWLISPDEVELADVTESGIRAIVDSVLSDRK